MRLVRALVDASAAVAARVRQGFAAAREFAGPARAWRWLAPLLTVAGGAGWLVCVNRVVVNGRWLSADERHYAAQALRFLDGRLVSRGDVPGMWLASHTWRQSTGEHFWASKYPPGTSLLMALTGGAQTGLAGALGGALCLLAVHRLVRPYGGARTGRLATVLLALTPPFWGYAASAFSQVHSLWLSLLLVGMVSSGAGRGRIGRPAVMAAAAALLVLVRPSDAVCAVVALGVFVVVNRRPGRGADLAAMGFGLAAGFGLLGLYFRALTGAFRLSVYGEQFLTLLPMLRGRLAMTWGEYLSWYLEGLRDRTGWLFWSGYAVPAGYVVPLGALSAAWFGVWRAPGVRALAWLSAAMVGLYSFVPFMGWPFYGVRYQLVVVVLGAVLCAGVLVRLEAALNGAGAAAGRRWGRWAVLAVVVWQAGVTALKAREWEARHAMLEGMQAAVDAGCPEQSLVFLPPMGAYFPYFVTADGLRGVIDETAPRLLLQAADMAFLGRFLDAHPGWSVCAPPFPMRALEQRLRAAADHPFFVRFDGDHKVVPAPRAEAP
ncbi:MAG: hypothetical protein RL199_147 [Pseudomonadota bacterium]|jgi:hypothetical protein